MSKCLRKNWNLCIILLAFISNELSAQIVEPPNAYDEYEVIDSKSTQSLTKQDWSESVENIRGVEFQNLELNSPLISDEMLPENSDLVYKGRVFLENRKGVIYSIVDSVAVNPRLNILSDEYAIIDSLGKIKKPVNFYTYTNYENSIEKYEILIFRENDVLKRDPIAILKGDKLDYNSPIVWSGEIEKEDNLDNINNLFYVLRVYGKNGIFDETYPKTLVLDDLDRGSLSVDETTLKEKIYGTTNIAIQNIPITGSKVKFNGRDLDPKTVVKLDNQEIELDGT